MRKKERKKERDGGLEKTKERKREEERERQTEEGTVRNIEGERSSNESQRLGVEWNVMPLILPVTRISLQHFILFLPWIYCPACTPELRGIAIRAVNSRREQQSATKK